MWNVPCELDKDEIDKSNLNVWSSFENPLLSKWTTTGYMPALLGFKEHTISVLVIDEILHVDLPITTLAIS